MLNEEFLRMQKLAGLITESEFKRQIIKEMKIFDLKDKNGKPTELFKIENFSSVEDAIDMLNKYYGMGEDEVDSFYTDETGTGYNYAYVANDGHTRFVKSLDEFSDGYQTEEEWGVASSKEIKANLNENQETFTVIDKEIPMKPISGTKEEILKYFSSRPDMSGVKITPDGKAIDVEDDYPISDDGLEWIWNNLNSDEGLGGSYVIQK